MKSIILVLAALAFSAPSFGVEVEKVRAKNYTCQELQDLVQAEGTVHVYGFGSLLVHANENACDGYRLGERQEAYKTTWKTKDERFCVAGVSCRIDYNDDNN